MSRPTTFYGQPDEATRQQEQNNKSFDSLSSRIDKLGAVGGTSVVEASVTAGANEVAHNFGSAPSGAYVILQSAAGTAYVLAVTPSSVSVETSFTGTLRLGLV